jgi:hypothetical protein
MSADVEEQRFGCDYCGGVPDLRLEILQILGVDKKSLCVLAITACPAHHNKAQWDFERTIPQQLNWPKLSPAEQRREMACHAIGDINLQISKMKRFIGEWERFWMNCEQPSAAAVEAASFVGKFVTGIPDNCRPKPRTYTNESRAHSGA